MAPKTSPLKLREATGRSQGGGGASSHPTSRVGGQHHPGLATTRDLRTFISSSCRARIGACAPSLIRPVARGVAAGLRPPGPARRRRVAENAGHMRARMRMSRPRRSSWRILPLATRDLRASPGWVVRTTRVGGHDQDHLWVVMRRPPPLEATCCFSYCPFVLFVVCKVFQKCIVWYL